MSKENADTYVPAIYLYPNIPQIVMDKKDSSYIEDVLKAFGV